METKRCRQCGEIKPVGKFRPYYAGNGTYTICKGCEKINSRAKYLKRKGDKATESDKAELAKIYQLYEYQRLVGLKPPRRSAEVQDRLDSLLSRFKAASVDGPEELQKWLTVELTDVPEYYTDEVYEQLVKKYKPMLYIDQDTLTPVYDETHSILLNQILERFNKYEDQYYN